MKIPVANVYYLLCYAWNKLAEQTIVDVDAETCATLPDLFARVLHNGVAYLLKKGPDRDYLEREEVWAGVKGKIDFGRSVQRNLLAQQRVACRFEELSYDVLPNRILKATIGRLIGWPDLDPQWRTALRGVYGRFHEVSVVTLSPHIFQTVRLHRNNRFYDFLLRICELLYHSLLPLEQTGRYRFYDFTKDDERMAHVFEEFVRNFYRHEQPFWRVGRENIYWQYRSPLSGGDKLLPMMQTDVSLRRPGRLTIIDCKYYAEIFENRFGQDKLRSPHLYQLHAYLSQAAEREPAGTKIDGVLLYAAGHSVPATPFAAGEKWSLEVRALNLAQHWSGIRSDLLALPER